jgi:hypothetical protein
MPYNPVIRNIGERIETLQRDRERLCPLSSRLQQNPLVMFVPGAERDIGVPGSRIAGQAPAFALAPDRPLVEIGRPDLVLAALRHTEIRAAAELYLLLS